jgi:hypothetical protein
MVHVRVISHRTEHRFDIEYHQNDGHSASLRNMIAVVSFTVVVYSVTVWRVALMTMEL